MTSDMPSCGLSLEQQTVLSQATDPLREGIGKVLSEGNPLPTYWWCYFQELFVEAALERENRPRVKVASQRRSTLQTIRQAIGHWPEWSDVICVAPELSQLDPAIIEAITRDLDRLQEPQIRRRTGIAALEARVEKLQARTRKK